jgi:hypothetical protein
MASYYDQINGLGPKVWYRFNETSGTPVNFGSLTTTGNFANISLLNEQTDVDGRAVYFNGTTGHIALNAWPSFSLFDDKSFTIETWFKLAPSNINDGTMFRFSGANPVGNTLSVVVYPSSGIENAGKLRLDIAGIGEQAADQQTFSTNTYYDNKWHHLVVAVNTTSLKWYIDGNLITTKTLTTGTLFWDNYSSGNIQRLIATGRSNTSQTLSSNKYKGWLDEFAIYGYELSAQQVLDNFNAGASVDYLSDVIGTASALLVMPTFATETILTADPMTANAASGDHYNSTVTFPTMLETYMAGRTLETWYKFDTSQQLTNYGSLPTKVSIFGTNASTEAGTGIQGSGRLLTTGGTTGQVVNLSDNVGPLIADKDFSLGLWTKKATNELANILNVYDTGGSDFIALEYTANGYITLRAHFNNNTDTITSSTDIADGNWHYIAVRQSNNTLQLWVDNVSIGTLTITHSYSALDTLSFGGDSNVTTSEKLSVSQFYVATAANITSTEIGNIYTAGTSAEVQASARMPEAKIRFNSAFNDYIVTKNPLIDLRLDEGTGAPLDYGSSGTIMVSQQSPQGYTQNNTGLNTRAFKFTDRIQAVRGNYSLASGTLSSASECTIGIVFKNANATNQQGLVGFGGRGGTQGTGFSLQQLASSGYLRIIAGNSNGTTNTFTGVTNVADNKWHLAIIVKNSNTIKLYIDGKQDLSSSSSNTLTDSGEFSIAAISGIDGTTASRDTLIDEIFVTAGAFTAQEAFEAWQALRLEMDTTATATFPMPTNIAGTGNIEAVDPSTASSDFVMPTFSTDQILDAAPGTASALFVLPNFGGNTVIDANYGHTAATASAVFHEPQFQIGDFHSADHMDASALMVHPISTGGGAIAVPTAVALDATLVMPGIVTVLGAQHFAKPMESRASFVLPPAYFSLLDDPWYVRLYAQHAQQNIEPRFITSSLASESRTQVAKTILKFFDDVTQPITVGSGRFLENDLENKVFLTPESTDTTKIKVYPTIAPNLTPTPILDRGYFDTFGRQAVRVQNIEFAMPEEIYNSKLPFSLEFSIKTTKANQIIAKGQWRSFLAYGREETGFGLYNGKLYLMTVNTTSGTVGNRTPHPLNPDVGGTRYAILGNKNIADGNWHHIIVQLGYSDDRIQFWVDGQLDKQIITGASQYSRLYIMGSNNANTNYQSDFETSGWSYDKQGFIEERDVTLNSAAYVKYEPIKAEVAKATLTMTANNSATGNRGRALMLYWWPEDSTINPGAFSQSRPQEGGVTFDPGLSTDDFLRRPPQEYYGWNVYPVDITGRYVSELVKKEAYGEENIITRSIPRVITGLQGPGPNTEYLTNANGHFVDPITDARRYIDLVKDIDLTQFDTIFFKNYPEQSTERDSYTREEFADEYFNLREKTLFDNFIKSLRAALDTGISLYITNAELAVDLGIIDRYEDVSIMHEGDFETNTTLGNQYLNAVFGTTDAIIKRDDGWYPDLHKNNRLRVVNTYPELTDDPYYIWTDWAYFANDSQINFGGSDRPYIRSEYKPNGLQVGDTFLISNPSLYDRTPFQAVPFANIKSGKVITAFANTVLSAGTAIENPYKNHATTIVLEPGDKVMGKPIASKIFINFTERLYFPYSKSLGLTKENQLLELIQDEHINRAYQEGFITLAQRNEYLASPNNLDRKLEIAISNNNQTEINVINAKKYWTLNGDNLIVSKNFFDDPTAQRPRDGLGDGQRRSAVNRINKKGALSTRTVVSELPWFTIETGWENPTMIVNTPSMLTRGFRWLSNRNEDIGTVLRVDAMTAIATGLPMPVVVGDKDRTVYAQPALANARIIDGTGYTPTSTTISTLPMFAEVKFGDFVKNIKPDVFAATAVFRQNVRTVGIQEDEIVVYIHHTDPILYLREEVIK